MTTSRPTRRTTTPIESLAATPHSGLCALAGTTWIPDSLSKAPSKIADQRCTCGAGFLRLLAGA